MGKLHLCNAFFEAEVTGFKATSLKEAIYSHPIFFNLQYLPLLFGDALLVTDPLPRGYLFPFSSQPKVYLLKEPIPHAAEIESWGPSQIIQKFATERDLIYEIPPWDVVQKVSSKRFSHELSPLPHSEILENPCDLRRFKGKWVFKTLQETAGRGHVFSTDPHLETFAHKHWDKGEALLAEPWYESLLDFSSQWKIEKDQTIQLIGMAKCIVGPRGQYIGNISSPALPEITEEHLAVAREALERVARLGFFGHVGVDAFIDDEERLHPIVEINPRKTMGWAAIAIAERHFSGRSITLTYLKTQEKGLLPTTKSGYQLRIE